MGYKVTLSIFSPSQASLRKNAKQSFGSAPSGASFRPGHAVEPPSPSEPVKDAEGTAGGGAQRP